MSDLVFAKGVIAFTFLVTSPPALLREEFLARHPGVLNALPDEEKAHLNDPIILAQSVVSDFLTDIIKKIQADKTWPQGSVVQLENPSAKPDAAALSPVHQKIASGKLSGQLVSVRLGITRANKPFLVLPG